MVAWEGGIQTVSGKERDPQRIPVFIVCEGLSSYSAQNGKLLVILSQEVTQFDMFKRSMGCCGKKRLPTGRVDAKKISIQPQTCG